MKLPAAKVFVAYSSKEGDVAATVFQAVSKANSLPLPYKFEPWPFNDVSGRPLVSPILENIERSPYVVADITYFNLNVIYEIGFALGRQKRVMLVRRRDIDGDRARAQRIGIFDTLGYTEYENSDELRDILSAYFDKTPLAVDHKLDRQSPIYIVQPTETRHTDVIITSRIKKAGFRYRSFNPSEHYRMSATETLRQIASSSGLVCRLQEEGIKSSDIHNVRAMFAIGIADGMEKPALVLCPFDLTAPLDVRDVVKLYKKADDVVAVIANFCPEVVSYLTGQDPPLFENLSPLSALSVGDPMAENEMTTLSRYYLQTDQYHQTIARNVNLVVGRKGSGKTALFIRVRDKVRTDRRNIVVDLKPEGYQLSKFREDVLELLSSGAKQHLITAFWEYLILVEVAHVILEKDKSTYKQDHTVYKHYIELRDLFQKYSIVGEGDFSERLFVLANDIVARYSARHGKKKDVRLKAMDVTELLHTYDLKQLRESISDYLDKKDFVWILFDNLDKGWRVGGVDETDALIIRSLIDASRKIQREMNADGHSFTNVVFIRNDVYDTVMRNSADFGKEMRAVLDWTDADLLREMLRLRLVIGLDVVDRNPSFAEIWPQLCVSHYKGEESSALLISRSLMRPRNLLKLFNHCRGFATNLNRSRIEAGDIEKGLRAYSEDLFAEINRELEDVVPEAADILYEFMDTPSRLTVGEVEEKLTRLSIEKESKERMLKFLIFYGVLGLIADSATYYIFDVNYDLKKIEHRVRQLGEKAVFEIHPALWPVLDTYETAQNAGPILDIEDYVDSQSSSERDGSA